MSRVTYWLFVVCIPLLLLTSTVRLAVGNAYVYEYGFDKYEISEVTGIDEAQLSKIAGKLIEYFNSKVETPQVQVVSEGGGFELYHDYELVHLQDVKRLFQIDYIAQVASLAYIIIYAALFLLWRKGRWQELTRGVTRGCIITLSLLAGLGIASIFSFERMFIQFHLISFNNPYWMLDPSKDYLIMLFPGGFWQDVVLLSGGAIAVEALLLGSIAWAVPHILQRRKP